MALPRFGRQVLAIVCNLSHYVYGVYTPFSAAGSDSIPVADDKKGAAMELDFAPGARGRAIPPSRGFA